jgi:hypothetical protein
VIGRGRPAYLEFADRLLPGTIENARRSPYFATTLQGLEARSVDTDTIQDLPFVDRATVQAAAEQFILTDDSGYDTVFTGGSTGDPLIVPIGGHEQAFIRAFHEAAHAASGSAARPSRRALVLKTPYHAHNINTPVPMRIHKVGVYDPGSFAYGRTVLDTVHREAGVDDRCSVLLGIERLLRAFTLDCRAAGWSSAAAEVDLVLSNSQHLTRKWRALLSDFWNAPVIDRYGLAEVYGGATEDAASGYYVFDPPCFAEVVEVKGDRRIHEGLGELVLTPLFPFQQALPLLRYRTGDLVRVSYSTPGHENCPAIRPLGRIALAPEDSTGALVPSCIFYELLDDLDTVARTSLFLDARHLRDRSLLGHPRYKVRGAGTRRGRNRIEVLVEFASTAAVSGHATAIANRIRKEYYRVMGSSWPSATALDVIFGPVEGPDNPSYSP